MSAAHPGVSYDNLPPLFPPFGSSFVFLLWGKHGIRFMQTILFCKFLCIAYSYEIEHMCIFTLNYDIITLQIYIFMRHCP